MNEPSTAYRYMPEYQDDTPGGTWWAAGDVYGYPTLPDAHDALALLHAQGKRVTDTRIWRVITTQELV